MDHNIFQRNVMEMLLAGDDPILEGLRNQYENSSVTSTEFTGVGFFTSFRVRAGIPWVAAGKSFSFGDVFGNWEDLENSSGFVLFVEDGYLSQLEGYMFVSNSWPSEYSGVVLTYADHGGTRDLEKFRKEIRSQLSKK